MQGHRNHHDNPNGEALICTEKECDTESSTLHLCEEHRAELKDLLDNVDFLIVNLDPNIQAGKVVNKPGGQEGGNGTKSAGSRPPTTDTGQLRYLLWELPRNAYTVARDNPNAGQTLHMARIWVGKARDAVYGPDREEVDHEANRQKLEAIAPPMPTRQLVKWLRKHAKISIKPKDIRNWAARGKLRPVERDPLPTYWPHEIIELHAERIRA